MSLSRSRRRRAATSGYGQVDPRTAALFPGGRLVLDLGCGNGAWLDEIAPRYERAIGLDKSMARLSTRGGPPTCWEFVLADLDDGIPAEGGSADAVHANQVIEHVRNPLALAIEVRRVLRPGGIFVAATPNVRYAKHIARLLVRGRGPMTSGRALRTAQVWDDGHLHYLTPNDLRWIGFEAGFREVFIRALVAQSGSFRFLRLLFEWRAASWPVRELLSGNTLLVAYA